MRLWPRSLHYRLLLIVLLGLLLANGLSLTLVLAERMSSARPMNGRSGCRVLRGATIVICWGQVSRGHLRPMPVHGMQSGP